MRTARELLERAFKTAARRSARRDIEFPSVCNQPAWEATQKLWRKIAPIWERHESEGMAEGKLYRGLVAEVRLLQILEVQALCLASREVEE